MVFRRRHRPADAGSEAYPERDASEGESATAERTGPWDEADLDSPRDGRIDFGGLLIPAVAGMQVRVDAQENRVASVNLVIGDSTIQVVPFAAPRTEGIWDDVRAELAASVAKQGGTVDERDGPFGPELGARIQGRSAGGRSAAQPVRFIGVNGPRWFLRGMISGRAAVDPHQADRLEQVFRDIVVVRGGEPMAPRDPIPLRLPESGQPEQPGGGEQPASVDPFERGPEITEVR